DPNQLRSFDRIAEQLGVTNGTISRQQYLDYYQQRSERFGGMSSPGNPTMITMPSGVPAVAGSQGAGSTSPVAPPSSGSFSYTPGSGRGRGGWGSPEDMANMADAMFRRADKNGDGVLSNDELSDILRNERERFDTNGDGVIDINEFRAF